MEILVERQRRSLHGRQTRHVTNELLDFHWPLLSLFLRSTVAFKRGFISPLMLASDSHSAQLISPALNFNRGLFPLPFVILVFSGGSVLWRTRSSRGRRGAALASSRPALSPNRFAVSYAHEVGRSADATSRVLRFEFILSDRADAVKVLPPRCPGGRGWRVRGWASNPACPWGRLGIFRRWRS